MNQSPQLNTRKRSVSRVFSYTEKDIESILMQHFLLNYDEGLPEHFTADIKFVSSAIPHIGARKKVNIYVR